MTDTPTYDVVVAGAGPAGLAATSALAGEGLRVACANPVQPPRWPNTYGIWLDELRTVGLEECTRSTWSAPRVELDGGRSHRLDRTYALLDNGRARDELVERAERGDVAWLEETVAEVEPTERGVSVKSRSGEIRTARLAVDATGHEPTLVDREQTGNPGYQTAYGIIGACDAPLGGDDEMMLMDFRAGHLTDEEAAGPPSFLYAMEVDDGKFLLEETTLVARPKMAYDELERRLHRRLDHAGLEVDVESFERVAIPMGLPLPTPRDGVVPFGGAASMVHPATGYMVGRTLRAAPALARAVATGLDASRRRAGRDEALRRGWRAIWPRPVRRARELLVFGMETLLSLDARQTTDFFDAFFSLDVDDWSAYMSGRASNRRVARLMWQIFGALDLALKGNLAKTALSRHGSHLVRSFTR